MKTETTRNKPGAWHIALAAFLMVAASQFVFASHHFEHDLDGISDVCAVCLQIEQFDQPIAAASADIVPMVTGFARPVPPAQPRYAGARLQYRTRAPPGI